MTGPLSPSRRRSQRNSEISTASTSFSTRMPPRIFCTWQLSNFNIQVGPQLRDYCWRLLGLEAVLQLDIFLFEGGASAPVPGRIELLLIK